MAGGVPRRSGKASSVTAAPCQLPRRGSRGRFAPFLPPAFMRGEGHAVAGGVPRRCGGESLLSHGFAVPAPPEGKPRALRTVPAPRIYEGGKATQRQGESSVAAAGKASSVTAFAVTALPEGKPRALRTVPAPRIYEGGGPRSGRGSPPSQRGRPSQSRRSPRQLSQRESQERFALIW